MLEAGIIDNLSKFDEIMCYTLSSFNQKDPLRVRSVPRVDPIHALRGLGNQETEK